MTERKTTDNERFYEMVAVATHLYHAKSILHCF